MKKVKKRKKHNDRELLNKINRIITILVQLTLVGAIALAIYSNRWTVVFVSSLTLILTFLPKIIERASKIDIPTELEIVTLIFIYATLFLGEVQDYYTRYWWWDVVLHSASAVAFGFIGFMILFVLHKGGKIKARPITIALFSFTFALAIGAMWEIFEFAMDQVFGLNMQKSGLIDTMWDLIVDAASALLASTIGYIYLKKRKFLIFDKMIEAFVEDNPDLFK